MNTIIPASRFNKFNPDTSFVNVFIHWSFTFILSLLVFSLIFFLLLNLAIALRYSHFLVHHSYYIYLCIYTYIRNFYWYCYFIRNLFWYWIRGMDLNTLLLIYYFVVSQWLAFIQRNLPFPTIIFQTSIVILK